MRRFFIGEIVFLNKMSFFSNEKLEAGKIIGKEDGYFLVEHSKHGTKHKIDSFTLIEKKLWRPNYMISTGIQANF